MNQIKTKNNEVIIIGAGWSGLACAVTLAQHGHKVILLESSRHIGGRARKVKFNQFLTTDAVDNGQHIMLGAYHSTLALLKLIGLKESDCLERQKLELILYSRAHPLIQLKAPNLPAPLHLLFAFIKMQGLSFGQRLKIIQMSLSLAITGYTIKEDISVSQLLKKYKQPEIVIKALWEPLCLATMNTPMHYASAQVFLNVLKDSFSKKSNDSDLLFFRHNLTEFFCAPAQNFISNNGGEVKCTEKVLNIKTIQQKNSAENKSAEFAIQTTKHQYPCRNVVIATPATVANKLLKTMGEHTLNPKGLNLNSNFNYQYEPICTVYLLYPPSTRLPYKMVGFFDTTAQWAIDRSLCKQPGLIAVIISGPGDHLNMSHEHLAQTVHQELGLCLSDLCIKEPEKQPELLSYQVIIEKRATFSCQTHIEQHRPDNKTHIDGLFLAGDYTNTHYPSTLEGAIRSGQSAAYAIINQDND